MAVLSDSERAQVWAEFMRWWSQDNEPAVCDKAALRAAVDAVDSWVDANSASFNQALPQPFRGAASARQKARLLMAVVGRRFGVL